MGMPIHNRSPNTVITQREKNKRKYWARQDVLLEIRLISYWDNK